MDGVPLAAWEAPELSGGQASAASATGDPPGTQLRPGAEVSSGDLLKRGGARMGNTSIPVADSC